MVPRGGGNAHFFTVTRIRSGGQEKIKQTNKHEQCLGLTQEPKESYATLCIPDSIYGLTLAWVTSENSTKQLEYRLILTQSSSLDPIFSATVSGVDRICPWFHANSASSFVQPTLFSRPVTSSGHTEISSPKTLCLVSHQNRQRNRLLGGPPI